MFSESGRSQHIQSQNPTFKRRDNARTEALKRAVKFFDDNLPKIENFQGVEGYDPTRLEKDIFTTKKLSEKFRSQSDPEKQWSIIQEAIILNESELSDWFGSSTRTIRPSDHADYVEQTDGILEFPDQAKVAFDATYTTDPYQKVHSLKEKLDEQSLHAITYFEDDERDFKGTIAVPKVVLGFGRENLEALSLNWLDAAENIEGSKQRIAEHPVQMLLIKQMLMQFSAMELYAKDNLQNEEMARTYWDLKKQLLDVFNEKVAAHPEWRHAEQDAFTENLINNVCIDFGVKQDAIKDNIWPKKAGAKVFKIPRKDSGLRAAA